MTSAGPRSRCQKKKPITSVRLIASGLRSTSRGTRPDDKRARQPRRDLRRNPRRELSLAALLRQLAQHLPAPREIGGEREHDQQADRFHRLHAEQVHLRVAACPARCRTARAAPTAAARARAECRRSRGRRRAGSRSARPRRSARSRRRRPARTRRNAVVSRSGSRRAIIARKPIPQSRWMAGSSTASPCCPFQRRTPCTR